MRMSKITDLITMRAIKKLGVCHIKTRESDDVTN